MPTKTAAKKPMCQISYTKEVRGGGARRFTIEVPSDRAAKEVARLEEKNAYCVDVRHEVTRETSEAEVFASYDRETARRGGQQERP